MDKNYPVGKVALLQKELTASRQRPNETLTDYYDSFRQFLRIVTIMGYRLPQRILIENFLNGLVPLEQRIIDAAEGI